jgi:hypothetical protein
MSAVCRRDSIRHHAVHRPDVVHGPFWIDGGHLKTPAGEMVRIAGRRTISATDVEGLCTYGQ